LANALTLRQYWGAVSVPIVQGMAAIAACDGGEKVTASFQPFWSALKATRGERPRPGADEGPPSDGQAYANHQQNKQRNQGPKQDPAQLFHLATSQAS
jgi:hypothetical protein